MDWHIDDNGAVDKLFELRGRYLNNYSWLEDQVDNVIALSWSLADAKQFIDEVLIDVSPDRKFGRVLEYVASLGASDDQVRFLREDFGVLSAWRNALAHGKFQFDSWEEVNGRLAPNPESWRVRRITRKGERALDVARATLEERNNDLVTVDAVLAGWAAVGAAMRGLPMGMVAPPEDKSMLRSPSQIRAEGRSS